MALQPNHYGKTYLLELWIELEPDQRANLKKKLDEWIQQGIIELANSAWASPLVPVKKKDGRTRWVTELKHQGCYPLTNIQENLQKLKGAKIFTSINACGAYRSIQIEEGSRDCTAFISSFSTHLDISRRLSACPAIDTRSVYSRMLDLALAQLPVEYWLSYLDNILVYSMDTWDHMKYLRSIVEAHKKTGIKIQPRC